MELRRADTMSTKSTIHDPSQIKKAAMDSSAPARCDSVVMDLQRHFGLLRDRF